MANITIRGLEESTKNKLRVRAALRQRSMEAEAREILRDALDGTEQADADLAARIVGRFQSLGGMDLKIAPREPLREPPRLATRMRRK